jgi:hypothetical protein
MEEILSRYSNTPLLHLPFLKRRHGRFRRVSTE